MMFKRMMILGAMASALAFAGCQDRSQQDQEGATGGSGIGQENYDSRGGTDLHGTGAQTGGSVDDQAGTGGSGSSGVLGPWGGQPGNVGSPTGSDTAGDVSGTEDIGGSGNLGGSAGDQGATTAPDGMDGTDDPALDENSQGTDESLDRGGEIR